MPFWFNVTKSFALFTVALCTLFSLNAVAEGGISVGGTRIVYPQDAQQQSIAINNSSTTDSFLVQSWVESAQGQKSNDFVVTPPLYVSGPKNENTLRLMKVTGQQPRDRESLYYFVAKAIPALRESDKSISGKAVLRIATATRIKLFVRPAGLMPAADKAPAALSFSRAGGQLEITNPTPYYITLTDIRVGNKNADAAMAAPKTTTRINLPASGSSITFSTINDYGGITAPLNMQIK